ncbi:MAG: hypothetical protein ACRCYO_10985 [Bacteroidia bacterium]
MKTEEEQLDEYEGFERELYEYLLDYEKYLAEEEKLKLATIRRHTSYLRFMISQGCAYHPLNGFEDITLTIIGSKMVRSYNYHCNESIQLSSAYNISLRFFTFIYKQFGIANHELLNKLNRKK